MSRRYKGRNVHGILILDKPPGLTSNDALQKVKHLFKAAKAGHTGSLDRLATGLLPICLGEATKISAYLLEADKHYEAVCTLGITTTTADAEGEVLQTRPFSGIDLAQIQNVLARFEGEQMQIPPMHSALKRQGQPLYKLARQGITVEREARPVTLFKLELLHFEENRLHLHIHCSKGTYIRTLAEDIGEALGCGAYLSHLRRTGVGPYQEDAMWSLEHLTAKAQDDNLAALDALLLPLDSAVSQWPLVEVSEALAHYMVQGQPVQVPGAPTHGWVRIRIRNHPLLFALGEIIEDGRIAPKRLLKQS
jgi:tRNA pseudouridine55 synthase